MSVRIEPLDLREIEAAKAIIRHVRLEIFGTEPVDFEDMDQVPIQYAAPFGAFLVVRDGDAIVGTGAIRRLDERVCELKRMWFLPAYRGRGLGQRMAEQLLEFARSAGYERVRLDTSRQLLAANRLFERLGFRPIDRYNNGPGTIFLEKDLHGSRIRMTPNKKTVEAYMDGFRTTDRSEILSCLTDDVEWVIPGAFHVRGKDDFATHIVDEGFAGQPLITVRRMTEEDDVVVAEGSVRAPRQDGTCLDLVFCDVFDMRNGRIRRLVSYLMETKC